MASRSEDFGQAIAEVTTGLSLREVADRTGLNHTTIKTWKGGRLPGKPAILAQFCEGMQLDPKTRQALFALAGLRDPARGATTIYLKENLVLGPIGEVAKILGHTSDSIRVPGLHELSQEDQDVLRALILAFVAERRFQRGEPLEGLPPARDYWAENTGADYLFRRLRELEAEFGEPISLSLFGAPHVLDVEAAKELVAHIRAQLEASHAKEGAPAREPLP